MSLELTKNTTIYMSYMLRYATFPLTAADLYKMAKAKNFPRLADYFADQPETTVYNSTKQILEQLKKSGHQIQSK